MMKPNQKERRQPSRSWRKKYPCPKNKGNHQFALVIPPHVKRFMGKTTPEVSRYYEVCDEAARELDIKAQWARWARKRGVNMARGSYLRYWKCADCGKQEMDSEQQPEKKIRDNLVDKP